jgi:hypothetical protein
MVLGIIIGSLAVLVIGLINVSYAVNSSFPYISREDLGRVVDYCFSDATSQNPVQDLITQGLLGSEFSSYTCSQMQLEKRQLEFAQDAMKSTCENLGLENC